MTDFEKPISLFLVGSVYRSHLTHLRHINEMNATTRIAMQIAIPIYVTIRIANATLGGYCGENRRNNETKFNVKIPMMMVQLNKLHTSRLRSDNTAKDVM